MIPFQRLVVIPYLLLTTQYSSWFILLCLLVGAGYAALQYSAKAPWSRQLNYALAALRFVVVSFLCYLLLAPFIRSSTTRTENPAVVLAVDNSESVPLFTPAAVLNETTAGLARLASTLRDNGFSVETRTLTPAPGRSASLDSLRFTAANTDLDQLLAGARSAYEGRNLAGVVLVSDGLVNQGRSPVYSEYNFPIYSVAVGDTVPKQDLRLTGLTYNRVAFSGNKFPIEAELGFEGYAGGARPPWSCARAAGCWKAAAWRCRLVGGGCAWRFSSPRPAPASAAIRWPWCRGPASLRPATTAARRLSIS